MVSKNKRLFSLFTFFIVNAISFSSVIEDEINVWKQTAESIRNEDISIEERSEIRQEWLYRLLDAAKSNPLDENYLRAMQMALGISNSLGEYDLSKEIAAELLEDKEEWSWNFRWLSELGEVSSLQYQTTKGEEIANDAIAFFNEANKIANQNETEIIGHSQFSQQAIINSVSIAGLEANVFNNYIEAANQCQYALALSNKLSPENQANLEILNFNKENFLSLEMEYSAIGGDLNRAFESLNKIKELGNLVWAPSFYLNELAQIENPNGGESYIETINAWLSEENDDSWTPFLKYWLGREYINQENYIEAIGIFSELLDKYEDVFIENDRESINKGAGGYLADIIEKLAIAFIQIEAFNQAYDLLIRFEEMYPNDTRIGEIQGLIRLVEEQLQKEITFNESLENQKVSTDVNTFKDNNLESSLMNIPISKIQNKSEFKKVTADESEKFNYKFGLFFILIVSMVMYIYLVFIKKKKYL